MAELTYKQREKLEEKGKNFALPKEKKYPLVNAQGKSSRSHASNAKARATQMYDKGKLSLAEEERIDEKANKVLKKTEPKRRRDSDMKPERKKERRDDRREMDRKSKRAGEREEKRKMEHHEMSEDEHYKKIQHHLKELRKINR